MDQNKSIPMEKSWSIINLCSFPTVFGCSSSQKQPTWSCPLRLKLWPHPYPQLWLMFFLPRPFTVLKKLVRHSGFGTEIVFYFSVFQCFYYPLIIDIYRQFHVRQTRMICWNKHVHKTRIVYAESLESPRQRASMVVSQSVALRDGRLAGFRKSSTKIFMDPNTVWEGTANPPICSKSYIVT